MVKELEKKEMNVTMLSNSINLRDSEAYNKSGIVVITPFPDNPEPSGLYEGLADGKIVIAFLPDGLIKIPYYELLFGENNPILISPNI